MRTRLLVGAALTVAVAAWGATRSAFDVAAAAQDHAAAHTAPAQQPNMPDMMKKHEQMMADMKAGDAKLDALVKEMNAAAGDARVNAVAAVVNELVRQHKAMHGHMGQMHEQMMGMGRGRMMRQ
jgi:hypothetical protein